MLNKQIYEKKNSIKLFLKELGIESNQDLINKIEKITKDNKALQETIAHKKEILNQKQEELSSYYPQFTQNLVTRKQQRQKILVESARLNELVKQQNDQIDLLQKQNQQLQMIQLQQKNELAKALANSVNQESTNLSNKTESPARSPQINYKEMKYKKYVSNDTRVLIKQSPTTAIQITPTVHPVIQTNSPSISPQTEDGCGLEEAKTSDTIKLDVSRINSTIMKSFNESDNSNKSSINQKRSAQVASLNDQQQRCESRQSSVSNKKSRKNKENKIETLKTKKGDREVIMSAGCLTTVVNRKNDSPINNMDMNTSKNSKLSSISNKEKPIQPQMQPIKLKINCKESRVKILSSDCDEQNDEQKTSKSKHNAGDSENSRSSSLKHSSDYPRKKSSEGKHIETNSQKRSDSPGDSMKRPGLVLKLGSNGQYYTSTPLLDEDDKEKSMILIIFKLFLYLTIIFLGNHNRSVEPTVEIQDEKTVLNAESTKKSALEPSSPIKKSKKSRSIKRSNENLQQQQPIEQDLNTIPEANNVNVNNFVFNNEPNFPECTPNMIEQQSQPQPPPHPQLNLNNLHQSSAPSSSFDNLKSQMTHEFAAMAYSKSLNFGPSANVEKSYFAQAQDYMSTANGLNHHGFNQNFVSQSLLPNLNMKNFHKSSNMYHEAYNSSFASDLKNIADDPLKKYANHTHNALFNHHHNHQNSFDFPSALSSCRYGPQQSSSDVFLNNSSSIHHRLNSDSSNNLNAINPLQNHSQSHKSKTNDQQQLNPRSIQSPLNYFFPTRL